MKILVGSADFDAGAEIRALAREGLGFKDINERLGETLTAQALYYYRTTTRK